jgi:hypothetical protein
MLRGSESDSDHLALNYKRLQKICNILRRA